VVTSTTHKTLRGPRGGLILCVDEFREQVDKGCPLVIGGPLPHMMAAKAVAFKEANTPEFRDYAKRIVTNAKALAEACCNEDMQVVTGSTDNHLLLLDVRGFGLNGRQAEVAVRECGITLNRNSLPYDPNGPWFTSGLRVGTPAITSLNMGVAEMNEIAAILKLVLANTKPALLKKSNEKSQSKVEIDEQALDEAKKRVQGLLKRYPVYPDLDIDFLMRKFANK
jgi:glycine hydroxymethyltransferase